MTGTNSISASSLASAAALAAATALRNAVVLSGSSEPATRQPSIATPSTADQLLAQSATRLRPPSQSVAYASLSSAVAQGFLLNLLTPGAGRGQYINLIA